MDYRTATDRLTARVTLEDVAKESGVSYELARQARLDPGHVNYRNPPVGWEAAVAKLARNQAAKLNHLADELERGG